MGSAPALSPIGSRGVLRAMASPFRRAGASLAKATRAVIDDFRLAVEPARSTAAAASPGAALAGEVVNRWKAELLEERAFHLAAQDDAPQIALAFQAAAAAQVQKLGRPLTDKESAVLWRETATPIAEPNTQTYLAAFQRDAATEAQAVATYREDVRPRVAHLMDPFQPLADGDAAARAKEMVVWESPKWMVLADPFDAQPHALVIPKRYVNFVTDLTVAEVDELGRIAAAVSAALVKEGASTAPFVFINPPDALEVGHLHCHVILSQAQRTDGKSPHHDFSDPKLVGFWRTIGSDLNQALGQVP